MARGDGAFIKPKAAFFTQGQTAAFIKPKGAFFMRYPVGAFIKPKWAFFMRGAEESALALKEGRMGGV